MNICNDYNRMFSLSLDDFKKEVETKVSYPEDKDSVISFIDDYIDTHTLSDVDAEKLHFLSEYVDNEYETSLQEELLGCEEDDIPQILRSIYARGEEPADLLMDSLLDTDWLGEDGETQSFHTLLSCMSGWDNEYRTFNLILLTQYVLPYVTTEAEAIFTTALELADDFSSPQFNHNSAEDIKRFYDVFNTKSLDKDIKTAYHRCLVDQASSHYEASVGSEQLEDAFSYLKLALADGYEPALDKLMELCTKETRKSKNKGNIVEILTYVTEIKPEYKDRISEFLISLASNKKLTKTTIGWYKAAYDINNDKQGIILDSLQKSGESADKIQSAEKAIFSKGKQKMPIEEKRNRRKEKKLKKQKRKEILRLILLAFINIGLFFLCCWHRGFGLGIGILAFIDLIWFFSLYDYATNKDTKEDYYKRYREWRKNRSQDGLDEFYTDPQGKAESGCLLFCITVVYFVVGIILLFL